MPLVLFLFFFSGAAGLAYQVLWIRQLSIVFGVTAYAAGTVLAAFMAGLALGSWLAGPLLAQIKRPLSAFGAVELLIGASALGTPAALDLASTLYRALYDAAPESFLVQTLARFACAFVVLLVPTALMGMTLPLLSASPAVRSGRFASHVSALYAVNTSGAVVGALVTGFVLIGSIGVSRTFFFAAACNALAGLGALLLDRVATTTTEPEAPQFTGESSPKGLVAVWWVMAASGFASLALEIVWFRLMMQALDGTTYAVTVTLASVLIGIAVGGAVSARLLARDADWLSWLTMLQAATACAVLLGVGILTWEHPLGLPPMRAAFRVVALVLMPSLLMGISFPMLLRLGVPAAGDASARGRLVGRFYSVNVLGAIAGSIAGGFLIVPVLGTWTAAVLLAAVYLVAALLLALRNPQRGRAMAGVTASAIAFVLLASIVPDPFAAATRRRAPPGSAEIFRDDGVQTPVSVYESASQRTLNRRGAPPGERFTVDGAPAPPDRSAAHGIAPVSTVGTRHRAGRRRDRGRGEPLSGHRGADRRAL